MINHNIIKKIKKKTWILKKSMKKNKFENPNLVKCKLYLVIKLKLMK